MRCEALEQRLDGEGAVLLATHKRQQQQIVMVTQAHEHLAFHAAQVRAILAAKLASNGRHAHMRLVLHGWRLEACKRDRHEGQDQEARHWLDGGLDGEDGRLALTC